MKDYILLDDGSWMCPYCGEILSAEHMDLFGFCGHCSESLQYLTT